MRRRKLLLAAGAGIGTIAGCTEFDSDSDSEDGDTDAGDSTSSVGGDSSSGGDSGGGSTSREEMVNDRQDVSEDEWHRWAWDLNRQATLEYSFTVRDGPEVDVFVLDDLEYEEYQSGNRFRAYSSDSGVSGGGSVTLAEDSYRLVIDNTGAGDVSPPTNFDDDVADVEIEAYIES